MARTLAIAVAVLALSAAAAAQSSVIPTADFMSRGLDMISAVQRSNIDGKELLPVLEWTYDNGQTWTCLGNRSIVWKVPDQLSASIVDTTLTQVDEALSTSYNEWIDVVRSNFNVGAGVTIGTGTKAFTGNFKFNHESYDYKEQMKNNSAASAFSRHWEATHQLEAYPPFLLKLNPMFAQYVASLPDTIKTAADQQKYNTLVTYWGTHYPMLANFGGDVHVNTFVSKSFMQSHSQSWVSNQFSLTFHYYMFQLSGGGFTNHSQIHISAAFKQAAHTLIFYRGGNPGLQGNTTANEWAKSIPETPVYLNVTVSGLEMLVSDPVKSATLGKVITSYMKTGKLPKVSDDLDYGKFYSEIDYRPNSP